ncbi:MAG: pyridoxal-phosphate-dependent aminotransferase family protein [Desulfitobacteriaceae bacterium]
MKMKHKPLLFTVGPVEMEEEIRKEGAVRLPYFRTDEFSETILSISSLIKELVYTEEDSKVLLLTASGTGAMEAAVGNLFSDRDKVLIVNGGTFGQRFTLLCETLKIPFTNINLPLHKKLNREQLLAFKGQGYSGLLVNANETSTGMYYDLPMIGQFCQQENMLLVVDAISSFLADPYFMDQWFIDVTILSSQKALAIAPGLSIIILNKKATDIVKRNHPATLYFDLKRYILNMENGQTPFTPAIGVLLQLRKRLLRIKQMGVPALINHTRMLARDFREKVTDLPFDIPSESLSNALTPLSPLNPISAYDIFLHLKNKYNVYVNPNSGELKDVLFRVGHMGNLTLAHNKKLIDLLHRIEREGLL